MIRSKAITLFTLLAFLASFAVNAFGMVMPHAMHAGMHAGMMAAQQADAAVPRHCKEDRGEQAPADAPKPACCQVGLCPVGCSTLLPELPDASPHVVTADAQPMAPEILAGLIPSPLLRPPR